MIDPADQPTQALPLDEQPAKRKRGRPATGKAMTPAEKQRAYRERAKSKQPLPGEERAREALHRQVIELRQELMQANETIKKLKEVLKKTDEAGIARIDQLRKELERERVRKS